MAAVGGPDILTSTPQLLAATVAPVTAQRHLDARQRFHQEINLWSFSNGACDFYESCTVIYENIIPTVYASVIDLFMKTAIVLRKCQRQPNHSAASSGSHCSMKPKPVDRPSLQTKPQLRASKANGATTC